MRPVLLLLCALLPLGAVELIEDDSPAALTALGNEATQSLQYDRAISLYKRALNKDPSYIYAMFNLGVVYQQRQEPDRALEQYTRVLTIRPDHPQSLNNSGIIAFQRQDYRLAIKYFNGAANVATNQAGDTAEFFFNLGTAHERLEEWSLAQKAYNNALSHNPKHFGAHYNLGTLYLDALANPGLAEQHLMAAHRIDPGSSAPLLNLALLAERYKRGKDPETWYNEAVRVAPAQSPTLATALWKRANYYNRLSPPRRIDMRKDLQVILDIDAHFPGANGLLGLYHESLAQYDKAITYLEREVDGDYYDPSDPIDLECHYTLSQIYIDHQFNLNKALYHAKLYNEQRPNSSAARRLSERISQQQARQGGR